MCIHQGFQSEMENVYFWDRRRIYLLLSICIVVAGLGLRLLGLNKGIWLDEYSSLSLIFNDHFLGALRQYDHPPLYFVLLKIWSSVSINEKFLRLLSVFFGVSTLAVTMRWLWRYDWLASVLVGLVCATLPILLRYSQEIRDYPLLLLATAAAFFFATQIVEQPEQRVGYVGLACSLIAAVSTHLVGVMVVTSVGMFILLQVTYRRVLWHDALWTAALPIGVFLFFMLIFLQQLPSGGSWWIPPVSFDLIQNTFRILFGMDVLDMVFGNLQQTGGAAWITSMLHALGVLLLIGVALGDWRQGWPLFAAALLFWAQVIAYSLIATPIFWYRTVLPGLIPLIAFVAVQIATIRVPTMRFVASAALIIVSLVFATEWATHRAWTPYEQWRQLAEAVQTARTENQLVVFYPRYVEGPIGYYYAGLPSNAKVALSPRITAEEFMQIRAQAQAIGATGAILVVRSDLTVQQHLDSYDRLQDTLEQHFGVPTRMQEFGLLSLRVYE